MFKKIIALIIIGLATFASIHLQMPENDFIEQPNPTQFSNVKAMHHVQQLAKVEHAVASEGQEKTLQYLIGELQKMGLKTQTQEAKSYSNWGTFAKVKNVITRIKGTENGKALLLMTHYDSSGSSSFGASDAGSGVATILEGIRSFLASHSKHKNDIIILITDAEEIGLNGANAFVKHHPWIQDVGLILNFEARGTGGPSFTLAETNDGNSVLIQEFIKANPSFPVANSLAYSIYKKLPNDTDLTVFRKQAKIQGFNFAFIDDHYDYHSSLDVPERLDNNSLSHQASYLMPLLNHFSNVDLTTLESTENHVYFNSPLGMHWYPYTYILPLVIIAFMLFAVIFYYGKKQQKLNNQEIGKGFLAFFSTLILNGVFGFLGWKLILQMYPQYQEILQGFPYNGHLYILFFVLLAIGISFYIYKKVYRATNTKELLVAPILFWLIINVIIAFYLKGASFFIIPTYFTLALWFFTIRQAKPSIVAATLLCLPAIFILAPFAQQFPIALGLKIVVSSTVLVTILFGLLLPVFGFIRRKRMLSRLFFIGAITTFIMAHANSNFTAEKPRPNSLVFMQDNTNNKSYWMSYDNTLDDWNTKYFKDKTDNLPLLFNSKYHTNFKHTALAKPVDIEATSAQVSFDTIIQNTRNVRLCISPKRNLNNIIIQSKNKNVFEKFSINGTSIDFKSVSKFKTKGNLTIAQYFCVDNQNMEIDFTVDANAKPELTFFEISYDLLHNNTLQIPARNSNMITKPFVINDAVIVKHQIQF